MSTPSCGHCRFFYMTGNGPSDGQCRRHSPLQHPIATHLGGRWPLVLITQWCGDFEQYPPTRPAFESPTDAPADRV